MTAFNGDDGGPIADFAFLVALLWNQKVGRMLAAEDREFPEHVDLGGES